MAFLKEPFSDQSQDPFCSKRDFFAQGMREEVPFVFTGAANRCRQWSARGSGVWPVHGLEQVLQGVRGAAEEVGTAEALKLAGGL